ncbi:tripartite tricarboxylate transporter substrate-binding protein [Bradyrhizobium jicamae]|uniref:tripartite tricarboxylate transporter substrate-binding protein n=1 Tax=Bradyrhizobium jicamae TaxID=280332 RepID=UPI002898C818|nr:tripartite tricarboxylate transporter substrate-binding protein [Bradyrhizobium jicamae]
MRKHLLLGVAAAFVSIAPAPGAEYPARPITFVVPFAAGGPLDFLARAVAEPMSERLGQPIVIENVPGAGGSIGVGRSIRATPDGYSVSVGNWSTHVLNGAMYALHYDLLEDLTPVALLASAPQIIIGKRDLPAGDFNGLASWLRTNKANVGTAGIGSASHVGGLLFQNLTKVDFAFIPYRSAGAALQDLVAGHVDLMFDQASNSLQQIRAGTIKAYAVTSRRRLAVAPDIPTVDEAGLPGFYISVWSGLWVPKGTPPDVITKLSDAAAKAIATPALRKRLTDLGLDLPAPDQQSPAALAALQKAEIVKWWPLIRAANVKAD